MKVIAIGGNPGSGKSTLMKKILELIGASKDSKQLYELVPGHTAGPLITAYHPSIIVLGKYDEDVGVFGGTDKMSMAVMPKAMEFLKTKPADVIIFEGDRLFAASFLEFCAEISDLSIIHLETTKDVREQRYRDRGSNQNKTWLEGRETKISNIMTNMMLMDYVTSLPNNTIEEQAEVISLVQSKIKDKHYAN